MKRREFSVSAASVLAASTVTLAAMPVHAQNKPQAGKDYAVLDTRAPVDTPADKVEVIEFFWYSCSHCNAFEPALNNWIKAQPKDVVIKRVPVAFQDSFIPQQKLFYALEALGKVEALHDKVFYAIHVEKQALNTDAKILDWAVKQGLDKAKFQEAYNSFSVAGKVKRATLLQEAYKVEGVPALGIAGRYYTDGSRSGSMGRALQVTDTLVADARKAR